jgi:hypothetical protein
MQVKATHYLVPSVPGTSQLIHNFLFDKPQQRNEIINVYP